MSAQAADLGPPRPQWASVFAGYHPVLFDGNGPGSWADGTAWFAAGPDAVLLVHAPGLAELREGGRRTALSLPPFEAWRQFLARAWARGAAGVATALSYDLKHWTEPHPRRLPWPPEPLLFAAAYPWVYVFDYTAGAGGFRGTPPADATSPLCSEGGAGRDERPCCAGLKPSLPRPLYEAMVRRALGYIAAGDIYQVNLAHTFRAPLLPRQAPRLFATLRQRYPAPFAAFLETGRHSLVSASPECFLLVEGREVRTFPIKGTRRRDGSATSASLRRDPKERAEHVMIVDLERNDLGRVCRTGSVEASREPAVCSFPLLDHMVSEVRGVLREEVDLVDLLAAVFPGGSITGAPKRRAIEIIEELEPEPRGMYTGAIGWIEPEGRARFNVAIRTAVIGPDGLRYASGGGIVADSRPDREYEETLLKAEAMDRALRLPPGPFAAGTA